MSGSLHFLFFCSNWPKSAVMFIYFHKKIASWLIYFEETWKNAHFFMKLNKDGSWLWSNWPKDQNCNEPEISFFWQISDADECKTCPDVLQGLEKIDTETDNLDITFIKINDPRYARKYGVTKLPALVYFRKKFPSIYRGKISKNMKYLGIYSTVSIKRPGLKFSQKCLLNNQYHLIKSRSYCFIYVLGYCLY